MGRNFEHINTKYTFCYILCPHWNVGLVVIKVQQLSVPDIQGTQPRCIIDPARSDGGSNWSLDLVPTFSTSSVKTLFASTCPLYPTFFTSFTSYFIRIHMVALSICTDVMDFCTLDIDGCSLRFFKVYCAPVSSAYIQQVLQCLTYGVFFLLRCVRGAQYLHECTRLWCKFNIEPLAQYTPQHFCSVSPRSLHFGEKPT